MTIEVFVDGDPEPHARIAITALSVAPQPPASECGCSTGGPTHGIALAAAVLFLVLRRRVTR